MGRDVIIKVERRNKDNLWEDGNLYIKSDRNGNSFEEVAPYDGRNSELFGILEGESLTYLKDDEPSYEGESIPQRNRLPDDISKVTKDEYDAFCSDSDSGGFHFKPTPNYLTFLELLYLDAKNKGIKEWDDNMKPILDYMRVSIQANRWDMDVYETIEVAQNLRFIYWFA